MIATIVASMLAAQAPANVAIPEDWAQQGAPRPVVTEQLIRQAVRETLDEAKTTAVAEPNEAYSVRDNHYENFAADFAEARVPNCLKSEGLKRQSTLIFQGVLALPFVLVAKVRGKCN